MSKLLSYKEAVFQYGENHSGFGILTTPAEAQGTGGNTPLCIIFNAGLLHRSEPYRLNTLLARQLASQGFTTLRIDLAGKGDSRTRDSRTSNRESVAMDWAAIKTALASSVSADQTFVLMGLCSGADNAVKLALDDAQVRGVILLDPLCPRDKQFYLRRALQKLFSPMVLMQLLGYLAGKIKGLFNREAVDASPQSNLRDAPTDEELVQALLALERREGSVLAIFTSYAYGYYNQAGQLGKVLSLSGSDFCREFHWPEMSHLYALQSHREKLIATISSWMTEKY